MCSLTAFSGEHLDFYPKWSSSQDQRKCGNISISLATTSLTLHCVFCEFYSYTLENFLEHLKNQHFDILSTENSLWPEVSVNEFQINQEELELNETKIKDENLADEIAADPLMAEEESFQNCNIKCEFNESLHSDEPGEPDTQPISYAGKPKFQHICRLIHYIHEHPTLWDTQLSVHYIRRERISAVESITKQFLREFPNLSIDNKYVQNKFKDLKTSYYNYNKTKTKPNKNSEKYFELLYFLKDHEKTKEPKNMCTVRNKNENKTSNAEYIKCVDCEEMLPTAELLQKHVSAIHRRYKCKLCTQSYKNLQRHMESKHPEIPLAPKGSSRGHIKERICERCGQQFMSQKQFYLHIKRVHLRLRPYACPDCPKAYRDLHRLKSHRNSAHLNNREHVCDMCSKAFFDRKTLTQHKKIHSDARNYVCRVCSKTFRQAPALYTHMKTHQ